MPKINLKSALKAGATAKLNDAISGTGFSIGLDGSINASFRQLVRDKVSGNSIDSPLKTLYSDTHARTFKYPMDMDDDHYIIIAPKKRTRTARGAPSQSVALSHIVLPVPSNLTTAYNLDYNSASLGVLGAMATGSVQPGDIASAVSQVGGAISDVGSDILGALEGKGISESGQKALNAVTAGGVAATTTALAGKVGGLLAAGLAGTGTGEQVVNGLGVSSGLSLNPHLATVFNGVNFRDHQFTYKFVARNEDESRHINSIIIELKKNMLPSYTTGRLAFNYPNEFDIKFSDAIQPYLYHIGRCVLKDLSVNYNGEGIPVFFDETQAPVSIEIQMTFQEVQIVTKETIESLESEYTTSENDANPTSLSSGGATSAPTDVGGALNALGSDEDVQNAIADGRQQLGAAADMVDNAATEAKDAFGSAVQSTTNFFKGL